MYVILTMLKLYNYICQRWKFNQNRDSQFQEKRLQSFRKKDRKALE